MLLVDFIREAYSDFKFIPNRTLWQYFNSDIVLNVILPDDNDSLPDNKMDFYNYHIKGGTKVSFFANIEIYGEVGDDSNVVAGIKVSQLEKDMKKIKGLGNKGLNSFKELFGHKFTLEEMEEKSDKLDGVGNMTLNNIIEFYKK